MNNRKPNLFVAIPLRFVAMAFLLLVWSSNYGQTIYGTSNPQAIPPSGTGGFPCVDGPTVSTANFGGSGIVGTTHEIVSVNLDLTHTFSADLDIEIISPSGATLELSSDNGDAGDNYTNTVFVDGAPSITTGTAPFTGVFEPEGGSLNTAFAGECMSGNWTLSICDDSGGDTGTLISWSMTFSPDMGGTIIYGGGNPQPIPPVGTGGFPCADGPATSIANFADTGTIGTTHVISSVNLNLTHTFSGDLDIELMAPSGTTWELSTDNGDAGDNYSNTSFVDGAPSITTGIAPFAGTFEAEAGPFSVGFAGEPMNGDWQLSVCDDSGGDTGTLISWSVTFSPDMGGTIIYGGGNPQPIPPVGTGGFPCVDGPTTSIANFADTGTVGTTHTIASVNLDLTHTFSADLDIELMAPSGTIWELSSDNGDAGDNYSNTSFVDGAPSITTGTAPFTGAFEAEAGPLNVGFAGEPMNGDWQLNICDDSGGDVGTLLAWSMAFAPNTCLNDTVAPIISCMGGGECGSQQTFTGASNPQSIPPIGTGGFPCVDGPTTSSAIFADTGTIGVTHTIASVNLDLTHTFSADLDIEIMAPSGTVWELSSDNGDAGDNYTNTIFMDGAPSITTGVAPFTGIFEAEAGPMNTGFAGESMNGNWQLNICDDAGGDTGELLFYSITFSENLGGDADDITIVCGESTDPVNTGTPFVSDICDADPVLTFSDIITLGSCGGESTIVRTWTATDASGNSSNCVQTITTVDSIPPGIICPVNVVLQCGASTDPSDIGAATATDDCDTAVVMTFDDVMTPLGCGGEMTITRTWTATDDCGNFATCVQTIDVIDTTPPIAVCQDITVDFNNGLMVTIDPQDVGGGSFDNCGVVTLELSDDTFACDEFINTNSIVVQLTVTDECGNTSICDVTVFGTGAQLTIDCPSDITLYLDPGQCEAIVDYNLIAENLCNPNDPPDLNQIDNSGYTSGDFFQIGVTEQTWEASLDGAIPVNCTFTITVIEFPNAVPPVCNGDLNISVDANCMAYIGADMVLEGGPYGCYDEYLVEIGGVGSGTGGVMVGSEQVGGSYTVTVTDTETGISCWSTIHIEDKFAPILTCISVELTCDLDTDPVYEEPVDSIPLPYAPQVHEACGAVQLNYTDEVSGDECASVIIERTWIATDLSGNSASCLQILTIVPLDMQDLEMPEAYEGNCGGPSNPSVTGWPTVEGGPISGGNVCNIYATWEDKPLTDCGNGTKVVRYWTVLDWCNQTVEKGTQVIKLSDNEGPALTCPENITVSTDTWTCYADVNLIAPTGVDACGTPFTLHPSASQGTIVDFGGYFRIDDIPLGETVITWTAEDACGNTSTCSYIITVEDNIPPVPLCDEHTVVSLTNDDLEHGLTKVAAEVFDDGSYDNCGPVTFEVRRMTSCIDFDWTTHGAGIDETPNGIVNSADRGTSFKPMVPFSCCDVGQGPIMVELRVIDASNNSNSCMVEIEVQDKLSPLITAPPTVEVSCDFWFAAEETNGFVPLEDDVLTPVFGRVLDAFDYVQNDRQSIIIDDPGNDELPQPYNWGLEGWADDNCDVEITVRVRIFDDCSGDNLPSGAPDPYTVRLVERTFLAKDAQGNSNTALQRIWVVDYAPFYISDETCVNADPRDGVIWPCDKLYDDCPEDGVPVNYPTIFDDNCSLIGVTYEDTRFDFVDGACYKILREWTVIDWCQYESHPEEEGIWRYTQTIKVIDNEGPEVSYPSTGGPYGPITLCALDSNVTLPANNQVFLGENNPLASSCSVHIVLEHDVVEMCSESITYDLKIYLNNGSEFIQVLNETEAAIDSNGNGKLYFDSRASSLLGIRLNGLEYNSPYCSSWPLSGGEKDYHRVLWSMEDGCGNASTFEYLLRLEDCKAPSPVCLGLSSVVMPSGGDVTIWAVDFNASSFDDCTAAADLLYSFSETDYEPSRTFDCQAIVDNGSPSFLIELYVADEGNDQNCDGVISWDERNKDFCTTFIVIDDNDGVCGGGGMAGGLIETEELETVENVSVTLMDELGLLTQTIVTDGSGSYVFVNPLLSYTIEPNRDDDHKNGVSTLDLVRIQKHLLGLEPFMSPYKMIAADANNSESVTALDLVEIRKLILGLNLEFPNNESWRFVDAEFVFADDNHPWPFDEIIELENGFNMEEDFMAVKIGDVNGTVTANATQIEVRESRNILTLNALDRAVSVGEEVMVAVTAEEFASIFGYQFTLRTEGLKLASVDAGVLDMDATNVGVHKYHMTVSWHRSEAVDAQDGDVLFTLRFVSTMEGQLSEMMSIGSEITEAEAYRETGSDPEIMDVELAFGDLPIVPTGVEFALYQNEPNPFNDRTMIGFTLPEAMEAKISVFDITGRIIKIIEGEYNAGYNEVELTQSDLSTNGILYYRLDASRSKGGEIGDFSATKKMIIIN